MAEGEELTGVNSKGNGCIAGCIDSAKRTLHEANMFFVHKHLKIISFFPHTAAIFKIPAGCMYTTHERQDRRCGGHAGHYNRIIKINYK